MLCLCRAALSVSAWPEPSEEDGGGGSTEDGGNGREDPASAKACFGDNHDWLSAAWTENPGKTTYEFMLYLVFN